MIFLYNSIVRYPRKGDVNYTEMQASATFLSYTKIQEAYAMKKKITLEGYPLLEAFKSYLDEQGMSSETVKSYVGNVFRYFEWFEGSLGLPPDALYRANILDFKSYLSNIARFAPPTINYYLSALAKFNEFLIETGAQTEMAIHPNDYIAIQMPIANPWDGEDREVKAFLQKVLASKSKFHLRDYALFCVIAYGGPRISETINLMEQDVDLPNREILIRDGKGEKARIIFVGDKVVHAIEEYRKARPKTECPYLFLNRSSKKLTRGRVNQICKQYSDFITPHKLRHYWCSKSQEVAGYGIAETAAQAGHKDTRTTLRYTHPSKAKLKEKANLL